MKRIHIVGRNNSGKTTLIVERVTEFTLGGYRAGTIKHTHHKHELDTPGKDSHRHREAGASAAGILSPGMNAIFWPQPPRQDRPAMYEQFDATMHPCDIVLIEEDSQANAANIEMFRTQNSEQAKAVTDKAIHAAVTDDELEIGAVIWPRRNLNSIIRNIERFMEPTKASAEQWT